MPECKKIYIDLVPQNYERPSILIELVTSKRDDVNALTVRETDFFTMTIYDEVGERYESSSRRLMELQQRTLDIFRAGYLRVDGRAPLVKASGGGRDFDRAYVDVQITYTEQRLPDAAPLPLMEQIETKIEGEAYGTA